MMPPNVRHRGGEGALSPSSAGAAEGGEDLGGRPPLQGSLSTPSGLGVHHNDGHRPSSMRLRPLPPAANGDRPHQPLRRNSTPNPDTDLDADSPGGPNVAPSSSSALSVATWRVGTTDAVLRALSGNAPAANASAASAVRVSPPSSPAVAAIPADASMEVELVDAPPLPPSAVPLPDDDAIGGEGNEGEEVKRRSSMPPHNDLPNRAAAQQGQHTMMKSGSGKGSGTTLSALSQPQPPTSTAAASAASASGAAASTAVSAPIVEVPHVEFASPTSHAAADASAAADENVFTSLYQDTLFHRPHPSVDAVLGAACEGLGFDIAEMWLRTGPKTHQLTNSHLRPTSLEDSVRAALVDVYYGDKSSERTHRLSPALCKRAKEAQDVVWVTGTTEKGAEALRCSISNVRTAAAVPVCHEPSRTNMTVIFFSIRRAIMRPHAVEFLTHMSLASAVAAVSTIAEDIAIDQPPLDRHHAQSDDRNAALSQSASYQMSRSDSRAVMTASPHGAASPSAAAQGTASVPALRGTPSHRPDNVSVTGAKLDLRWNALKNVEYLTDGGNNWIHTAVMNGRPVVVKTLKPECQDLALAINEIEGELQIHSKLDHPNIVSLVGAGTTSKGSRFVVLERLDGGTLTQMLGYDTRIRDRRRRFWTKRKFSYADVLRCARSIAAAMDYCHSDAIPGCMVLHRDLKPSNIGFTLDGKVKLIDFGLARIVDNASPDSDDVYEMSGETGSLRYMAPEVADCRPYNHKADVYSFGIILWEIVSFQKPFDGMSRDEFYARVVHGGERPVINKRWPTELSDLMQLCWDFTPDVRPNFAGVLERLDAMLAKETGGGGERMKRTARKKIISLIDRHSTWF